MSKIPLMADPLPDEFLEALGDDYEVLPWDDRPGSPVLETAVAIIAYSHPTIDGPLMDRMPQLKVVSNHGVGVDHIDVAAARQRGIRVGNTPGCLDAATADMTLALILAVARHLVVADRFARSPEFTRHDPSILIGREVTGRTLGIIGMGRIGRQVARRARGFDMKLLYHNRNRQSEAEQELGVQYASLEELLRNSDFVSLHCPANDQTHHLISGPQLETMKSSAFLINMARGSVVETEALYEALTNGQIAGAGLDVTDPEPLPRDHPLLKLDNVVILPHIGSASDRAREQMRTMTLENLHAGLAGQDMPYPV